MEPALAPAEGEADGERNGNDGEGREVNDWTSDEEDEDEGYGHPIAGGYQPLPSSAAGDDTDDDAAGDDDKCAGNGAGSASALRSRAAAAAATAGIASGLGEDDTDAALQDSELGSELREAMAAVGGDFDFDDADGIAAYAAQATASAVAARIRAEGVIRISPLPPVDLDGDDFALSEGDTAAIRSAMAGFSLPADAIPPWARDVNGEETDRWQTELTARLPVSVKGVNPGEQRTSER